MSDHTELSDDDLWNIAGKQGSVSDKDLGIQKSSSNSDDSYITEGQDYGMLTFNLHNNKDNKRNGQ